MQRFRCKSCARFFIAEHDRAKHAGGAPCPKCRSNSDVVKDGVSPNGVQLFRCQKCQVERFARDECQLQTVRRKSLLVAVGRSRAKAHRRASRYLFWNLADKTIAGKITCGNVPNGAWLCTRHANSGYICEHDFRSGSSIISIDASEEVLKSYGRPVQRPVDPVMTLRAEDY